MRSSSNSSSVHRLSGGIPPPLPPRNSSPPPLPPLQAVTAAPQSPPPPLPPRPASPPLQPPAAAVAAPPPAAIPAELYAEIAQLNQELRAAKEALAAEQARSRQLQEAAAASQFKYELLVDMVRAWLRV